VCSEAELQADPSRCGCDAVCRYKVCGNGILQAGEECDPPGPACSDRCEQLEDTCTGCIRDIDAQACSGALLLDGTDLVPLLQRGCLNDQACFELWSCYRESLCGQPVPSDCYCGAGVSTNQCEQPAFEPQGVCRDQALAAFEAQYLTPPVSNAEMLSEFQQLGRAPSGFPSYGVAGYLAEFCLVPDEAGAANVPTTRMLLEQSGADAARVEACVSACFP
jgi:hypothetical protein